MDNTEMAEDAKNIQRTTKARFARKHKELLKSMDANQGLEMVEGNYMKLSEAWDIVESKHDLYTMYLTQKTWKSLRVGLPSYRTFLQKRQCLKSSIYRPQIDQKLSRERTHYVMNQK